MRCGLTEMRHRLAERAQELGEAVPVSRALKGPMGRPRRQMPCRRSPCQSVSAHMPYLHPGQLKKGLQGLLQMA